MGFPLLALAQIEGRWEGQVQLPGVAAAPVIIDITRQSEKTRLALTLVGRAAQGRVMPRFERQGDSWMASVGGGPDDLDSMQLSLRMASDGTSLTGELQQGGHSAPLRLIRSGPAPAPDAIASSAPGPQAWGVWLGRYDMGFGPREATLRLSAQGASLKVVGRRTSEINFDEAVQRGKLLMFSSSETGISIEAPADGIPKGLLAATMRQGPFEAPLVLRREVKP